MEECPRCLGTDTECEVCNGEGSWQLYRCPGALVDDDAWQAVRAAVMFIQHGFAPTDGGQLAQTPAFLETVEIVDRAKARYEKAQWEASRSQAKGR